MFACAEGTNSARSARRIDLFTLCLPNLPCLPMFTMFTNVYQIHYQYINQTLEIYKQSKKLLIFDNTGNLIPVF